MITPHSLISAAHKITIDQEYMLHKKQPCMNSVRQADCVLRRTEVQYVKEQKEHIRYGYEIYHERNM